MRLKIILRFLSHMREKMLRNRQGEFALLLTGFPRKDANNHHDHVSLSLLVTIARDKHDKTIINKRSNKTIARDKHDKTIINKSSNKAVSLVGRKDQRKPGFPFR